MGGVYVRQLGQYTLNIKRGIAKGLEGVENWRKEKRKVGNRGKI